MTETPNPNIVDTDTLTGEQQQAWMRKRVLFQAVAIVLVALILIMASASGG